jgi:hypothetical protein
VQRLLLPLMSLRHTTLGGTALDEGWACRRDIYLTQSQQPKTHALDYAATVVPSNYIKWCERSPWPALMTFPDPLYVATSLLEWPRDTDSVQKMIHIILHCISRSSSKFQTHIYIYISSKNKYFIVSTCELFASKLLVLCNSGLSEFDWWKMWLQSVRKKFL